MPAVYVTISRLISEDQPGWVECLLVDVVGRTWTFNEKVPVVTTEDLHFKSEYPKRGSIECSVLKRYSDAGRQVVTIDTSCPWLIESTGGNTVFDVFAQQLEDETAKG